MSIQQPGFLYLTASGVVARHACRLDSIIVLVSVAGALLSVYEGQDAASGRLIAVVTAPVLSSVTIDFKGIPCDRGLCLVFAANVTSATVIYRMIPGWVG